MIRTCKTAAAFFLAVALIPAWALAFELETPLTDSVTVLETLKVLWDRTVEDSDQHFWATVNRLTLNVAKGPVLIGARYDVEAYFEKDDTPVKHLPRKFYLQVNQRPLDLRIGDFYASQGRGLVLHVIKNDEFGEDTSIQGEFLGISTRYISYSGLAGVINEGDDLTFYPERARDPEKHYADRDLLWSQGLVLSLPRVIKVGAHYTGAVERTDKEIEIVEAEKDNRYDLLGFSLALPNLWGVGSLHAEYAYREFLDGKRFLDDLEEEGRGLYLAANFYFAGVDLLLEGKDYYRFTFPYSEPPTLEEEELAFELPEYEDEFGGRIRVGYMIPVIETYIYANYLHTKGHILTPPTLKDHYDHGNEFRAFDRVKHVYGGIERRWENTAYILGSGGYRELDIGRWVHSEMNAGLPVTERSSLTVSFGWRDYRGIGAFRDTSYGSELFQLTYSFSPYLDLTGRYEHSTEPSAASTGDTDFLGEGGSDKEDFWSVEAKLRPTSASSVSLFWGAEKGGPKCSGGVCRVVPSFEGLKAEFSIRF